jgi:hypothetical protein
MDAAAGIGWFSFKPFVSMWLYTILFIQFFIVLG